MSVYDASRRNLVSQLSKTGQCAGMAPLGSLHSSQTMSGPRAGPVIQPQFFTPSKGFHAAFPGDKDQV